MADDKPKCANEPCTCVPPTGQVYCSEYCRHAATSGPPRIEKVCECGHADCAGGS
jgi:hypothetical protein